jgi:alkylated DNA repair dioxygenase AlkB
MAEQPGLFDEAPRGPPGFLYRPDLISRAEEEALIAEFATLPFQVFEFHGFFGKRRTVSFGFKYDYSAGRLNPAPDMPAFLSSLRDRAGWFTGVQPEAFAHVLITEYDPGVTIGWHRDRPQFDKVVGISLAAPCTFRFRRRTSTGFERVSHHLDPRSGYLLDGPARTVWEHSIPPLEARRYSVTFRTLR